MKRGRLPLTTVLPNSCCSAELGQWQRPLIELISHTFAGPRPPPPRCLSGPRNRRLCAKAASPDNPGGPRYFFASCRRVPHLTSVVDGRTLRTSPAIHGGKDAKNLEAAARRYCYGKETASDRRVKATGEKHAA